MPVCQRNVKSLQSENDMPLFSSFLHTLFIMMSLYQVRADTNLEIKNIFFNYHRKQIIISFLDLQVPLRFIIFTGGT